LDVLAPQLLRQRHVIDEHHWWLNTTDPADIACVQALAAQHPDFFKVCQKPVNAALSLGNRIWGFFRHYCEEDTVYVRLDDDICYIADDAVESLVRCRTANRKPLLVLGNIVNNAVCTHFHQRDGLVPTSWGPVHNRCLDRMGWASGEFASRLHGLFLEVLRRGETARWKQVALPIDGTRRFSINVISWIGDDLSGIPEIASDMIDEEPFLTEELPTRLNRPNVACSNSLFAHFAFYTQRPYLEWTRPELLEHYQAHALGHPIPRGPLRAITFFRKLGWQITKPARKLRAKFEKRWRRDLAS
jgi:hypothetical protein